MIILASHTENGVHTVEIRIEPQEFSLRSRVGATVDTDQLGTLADTVRRLLREGGRYQTEIEAIRDTYIANFGSSGKAAYRAIMDAIKSHSKH